MLGGFKRKVVGAAEATEQRESLGERGTAAERREAVPAGEGKPSLYRPARSQSLREVRRVRFVCAARRATVGFRNIVAGGKKRSLLPLFFFLFLSLFISLSLSLILFVPIRRCLQVHLVLQQRFNLKVRCACARTYRVRTGKQRKERQCVQCASVTRHRVLLATTLPKRVRKRARARARASDERTSVE